MPSVDGNEFLLNYEITCPRAAAPTLLLIPGLGEQIGSVEFPEEQCQLFFDLGFQVVRTENRDSGLSEPTVPEDQITPYSLHDVADDVAAIIDDLGLERVHVLGASMGGFIARWVAIRHPRKVTTLTIVMSGSGRAPDEGLKMDPKIVNTLMGYGVEREKPDQIEWHINAWRTLWGNAYHFPENWIRGRLSRSFDRAYTPSGNARLLRASQTTEGLADQQAGIACPTLIVHGEQDVCFLTDEARYTHGRIENSELWIDPGMGHIMHEETWLELAKRVARRALPRDAVL